ncbi:hypothetical protein LIER_25499 [Lithospermum erythrorhizon]|uniref:Uncharacterized protein n=1 Tax=Lithospermum erythrorhizon TaxID=34254 RepID=A0AAV3R523_LITER
MVKPQNMEDATMALAANRNRFTNDPRGGGGRRSESGNVAVTQQGESQHLSFNKEQLEQIRTLLHTSLSPSAITGGASCFVSKTGNITSIFAPWIINSGASEHMTSNLSLFTNFSPTPILENPQISQNHHRVNHKDIGHNRTSGTAYNKLEIRGIVGMNMN